MLRQIDIEAFRAELSTAVIGDNLLDVVKLYERTLLHLLDKNAPEKRHVITIRHTQKGITDDIKCERRRKRRTEAHWRRTKTQVDRNLYTEQKLKYNKMLEASEENFYSDLVLEHASNSRDLFKILNFILNRKAVSALPPLPPNNSSQELAEEFSSSFTSKIDKIYANLEEIQSGNSHSEVPKYNSQLEELKRLTQDEVRKLLLKSPSKACELDPIPTWLKLLPLITRIVNLSFQTAEMLAILISLLKKIGLQLIFKNYRPISNLSFVSKLIERGAIFQLVEHMKSQNLSRSTETALLRIQNDILMAMECKQISALIMLDLSAAFDTINHKVLLQRLEKRVGITGKALQ